LRLPSLAGTAKAARVFADEAAYLCDPASARFEPGVALWLRRGELAPIAVPDRGLGVLGVGSTLSYTHFPPPLPDGLGAGLRAQLFTPPVADDSGAWLDDAVSTRLTLDDGAVRITIAPARDPRTLRRVLRVEGAGEQLPFPWDNGYANIVDIERRPDGRLAITATNLDPVDDGTSQPLLIGERPPSQGVPLVQFGWDREGRSAGDSSCWVRVSQQWGGAAWAGLHLPEIADEVLVSFEEGDPDRPIVIGSVYAGRVASPQPVDPRHDTWTIRTASGGGFLNELVSNPEAVTFDRGRQVFVYKQQDGRAELEFRFRPVEPPYVWGLELAARHIPSLYPLSLTADRDSRLATVLHIELQIGDVAGARSYRLRGSRRRLSA
jgi:Type VI secretion system/phage-baseplate injector OB domain